MTSGSSSDYVNLKKIGGGGQAYVFRATYVGETRDGLTKGQTVAVKRFVVPVEEISDFIREAKVLQALNHPNIVRFKDYYLDDVHGLSYPCLVTELLEGETLKDRLQKAGRGLPFEEAKSLLDQVLAALEEASKDVKFAHRDLKPSNIFVVEGNKTKLIDFGVSRSQEGEHSRTATSGGFKGSLDWMAPEFATDKNFSGDQVSDIFSFGVCIFQTVTGKLPFPDLGGNDTAFYERWTSKSKPIVPDHQSFHVYNGLASCIKKCLTVDRSGRFQTFSEVRAKLGAVKRRKLEWKGTAYELVEAIGKGGFGRVFRAVRNDGLEVAIKQMIGAHTRRFIAEATALRKAAHPSLVKYIDFLQYSDPKNPEQQQLYIILEYLPGGTLKDRIKSSKVGLPVEETLEIFSNYLECLHYLHQKPLGIIHRDIKPGNLYAPEGEPAKAKIFDLGIIRRVQGTLTRGVRVPGTLNYMAPELLLADGDDEGEVRGTAETDIYSVGVSLFECLTRDLPFPPVPLDPVKQLERGEKPQSIDFGAPIFGEYPELVSILRKALAHNPKDRYRSGAEMREQISRQLEGMRSRREGLVELSAAAADFQAGKVAEAMAHAAKAVQQLPDNAEAREMLQRIRLHADQTKFDQALAEASTALAEGRIEEAKRQAQIAGTIRASDPRLTEFVKRIEEKKKQADFDAAMAAGERALENGDIGEANRQAAVADRLRPRDPVVSNLRDRIQFRKKSGDFESAMKRARELFGEENFKEADRFVERALVEFPGDASALALRQELAVAAATSDKTEGLGSDTVDTGDSSDAEEVLEPPPGEDTHDHTDATEAFKGEVADLLGEPALDEAEPVPAVEREPKSKVARMAVGAVAVLAIGGIVLYRFQTQPSRVDGGPKPDFSAKQSGNLAPDEYKREIAEIGKALEGKDWASATSHMEKARALNGETPEIKGLRLELAFLSAIASAEKSLQAGDFDAAIKHAEEALKVRPSSEADHLISQAKAQKTAIEKKAIDGKNAAAQAIENKAFEDELQAGKVAFSGKKWDEAIRHADAALARKPKQADAEKLRKEAQAAKDGEAMQTQEAEKFRVKEAEEKKFIDDTLSLANVALSDKEWDKAIQRADEILSRKPGHAGASQIKKDALAEQSAQMLREEQAKALVEKKFTTAIVNAQANLRSGNLAEAAAQVASALQLKSTDSTALQLQREIDQAIIRIAEEKTKFTNAISAGNEALLKEDWATALASATEADRLQPNSKEAASLRDAVEQGKAKAESSSKAKVREEKLKDLNERLEILKIQFGINKANPKKLKTKSGAEAARIVGDIDDRQYLDVVQKLEAEFRALGSPVAVPAKELSEVRDKIKYQNQ